MKTVDELWKSFEKAIIPEGAPDLQRREMKKAFYGGAWSMMHTFLAMTEIAEKLEKENKGQEAKEQAMNQLDAIMKEMEEYISSESKGA